MAKIILLHGLHMHSWVMRPLAYLLEQEGLKLRCSIITVFCIR